MDAVSHAIEDLESVVRLERRNAATQGGLADVQLGCCLGKAATSSHRNQLLQFSRGNAHTCPYLECIDLMEFSIGKHSMARTILSAPDASASPPSQRHFQPGGDRCSNRFVSSGNART